MPEIRFAADTHPELVRQVRVWLESTTAERSVADVVEASAELTKDALRLIAGAAPAPIAQSDLVAELTKLGHQATDAVRETFVTWDARPAQRRNQSRRRSSPRNYAS